MCIRDRITETDIFGKEKKKNRKKSEYSGQKIQNFADLSIGDYVVHESHGLGIYRGIEKIEMDRVTRDYMKIEYAGGSNLYVLATQLDTLQKYASGEAAKVPKLNKIGGQEWNKTKTRVRHAVKNIAQDLVKLYAERQASSGYQFGKDTIWQKEFEDVYKRQKQVISFRLNSVSTAHPIPIQYILFFLILYISTIVRIPIAL